jgi:hypothetical protein
MKYTKYITQLESRMKQKDNSFWFVNKKFSRDNDIKRNYENFKNVRYDMERNILMFLNKIRFIQFSNLMS